MANTQDTITYGSTIAKGNAVETGLQTVLRAAPILESARGRGGVGIVGDAGVQTVCVYPTIDPITGEAEEPVRPPEYFRLGDAIYPARDPRAKPLKP